MLIITRLDGADAIQTLKLEGKLQGPWVGELRAACEQAVLTPSRIRLDLADVSFVDAAGVECIRELIREGVPILACSGFVASLLALDR